MNRHHVPDEGCRDVFAALSEYLDGELPAAACAELERHIADCPPCIEFLDSLKSSVKATRGYESGAKPEPLGPEVRRRLEEAWHAALARRVPQNEAR